MECRPPIIEAGSIDIGAGRHEVGDDGLSTDRRGSDERRVPEITCEIRIRSGRKQQADDVPMPSGRRVSQSGPRLG